LFGHLGRGAEPVPRRSHSGGEVAGEPETVAQRGTGNPFAQAGPRRGEAGLGARELRANRT